MTEHKIVNEIEYKQCSKCNEFKTLDKFQKRQASKDGYRDQCIDCIAILREARVKPPANITHKICSKCKQDKDISEFHLSSNSPDGYSYDCKDCRKLYRQQNIEHIRQYGTEYRQRSETKKYMKQYWEQYKLDNPEKIKESNQKALQHYYEHKEEILARQKEYYEQNREEINKRAREKYKIKVEEEKQTKEQKRLELLNKGLKVCSTCKQAKTLNDFWKNKNTVDGYNNVCRDCATIRDNKLKSKRMYPSITNKYCKFCEQTKPVSEFYKSQNTLDGYSSRCKACASEYNKEYSQRPETKVIQRKYHEQYSKENKEKLKEYQRKYRKNNKEKLQEMEKIRYESNKLNKNMSVMISRFLKGKKNEEHWENLLSYSLNDLKEHLESQFTPEMSWDNYGTYWEIDHIIPQNLFHIETENDRDFQICWSLANLRPLEKSLNRQRPKDGSDIPDDIKQNILNQLE